MLGEVLFGDDLFALAGTVEGHDFAEGELAELAGGDVEAEGSVADAADLFDVVADLFEHLAELAVAAFGEGELVPGLSPARTSSSLAGAVRMRSRRPERTSSRRPRSIMMPRRIWSRPLGAGTPEVLTRYVFSTPAAAFERALASSPSLVMRRRPSER